MFHLWDEDRPFTHWPESSHCKADISAAFSRIHWVYDIFEIENMTEIDAKFLHRVRFVFLGANYIGGIPGKETFVIFAVLLNTLSTFGFAALS